MSGVAAASESPPTVAVSLQPNNLRASLPTGFTTAHRRLIQIAGFFVVLVRDMCMQNWWQLCSHRKQSNRDIHQVTHDRGACQKGGYEAQL